MVGLKAVFDYGTGYENVLFSSGTLNDYVKCLSCGYLSAKPDKIFCVPLPVSKFDKSKLDKPKLVRAELISFVIKNSKRL